MYRKVTSNPFTASLLILFAHQNLVSGSCFILEHEISHQSPSYFVRSDRIGQCTYDACLKLGKNFHCFLQAPDVLREVGTKSL